MSNLIQLRIDRFPELGGINDEIEKALLDKQKNRQFKDAGKRVHGSRKAQALYSKLIRISDLYSIEEDEATAIELVKKDKVFPKVDPQQEKEAGTDSGCAFLKTKIRQAFPAKPHINTKEARAQYVRMAEALISLMQRCITINDLSVLYTLVHNGEIIVNGRFSYIFGKRLYNLLYAIARGSYNKTIKETLAKAKQYSGVDKEQAVGFYKGLKDQSDKGIKRIQTCMDSAKLIKSQADMKKHLKEDLIFRGGLLNITQTPEEYKEHVTKVCTRYIDDFKKKFDIKKEEFPYKEFKPDWSWTETKKITKNQVSSNPKIEAIPLSYIKRTGGLFIDNSDENTVINKLHFKSLTLGNYVKDDESREHIRHFVAAIVDLCEVLNLNLCVNENLAIAFGAFGRGGKAMATYYPTRQLINLTKRSGDGSVAHEWGHFFDHYLNAFEIRGMHSLCSEAYLPKILDNLGYYKKYFTTSKSTLVEDSFKNALKKAIAKTVPDIVHKSMAELVVMLRFAYYTPEDKALSYTERKKGEKRPSDSNLYHHSKLQGIYWKEIAEMFARSFECYVYDNLKLQGRVNNYLVSGGWFSHPVYPQGEERVYINKCFDNLISAIKQHYTIESFEPFTDKRADEYIDLTEKGTVNKGVIVGKERRLKQVKMRAKAIRIKQKQLKIS